MNMSNQKRMDRLVWGHTCLDLRIIEFWGYILRKSKSWWIIDTPLWTGGHFRFPCCSIGFQDHSWHEIRRANYRIRVKYHHETVVQYLPVFLQKFRVQSWLWFDQKTGPTFLHFEKKTVWVHLSVVRSTLHEKFVFPTFKSSINKVCKFIVPSTL